VLYFPSAKQQYSKQRAERGYTMVRQKQITFELSQHHFLITIAKTKVHISDKIVN